MDTPSDLPAHITFGRKLAANMRYNLSDSCAQTLTVAEVLSFVGEDVGSLKLTYASLQGDEELREAIAAYHNAINVALTGSEHRCNAQQVVTFSGAQEALQAVYRALLRPGDEVVVMTPCYPSLASMVETNGARLKALPLKEDNDWQPDLARLESMLSDKTRLLVVNSPHNPTGAVLGRQTRQQILMMAQERGCYLLSDDVSQGTNPCHIDLAHDYFRYDKAVMVSVMSKSFGLGGVRIGWAVAREPALIESLLAIKAQGSICTSAVDERLALAAFNARRHIFSRNDGQVLANLNAFAQFVDTYGEYFSWRRPEAGLLALVKVSRAGSIEDWCLETVSATGVGFMPASVFGLQGPYVRLGLGRADFKEGLDHLAHAIENRGRNNGDD